MDEEKRIRDEFNAVLFNTIETKTAPKITLNLDDLKTFGDLGKSESVVNVQAVLPKVLSNKIEVSEPQYS